MNFAKVDTCMAVRTKNVKTNENEINSTALHRKLTPQSQSLESLCFY